MFEIRNLNYNERNGILVAKNDDGVVKSIKRFPMYDGMLFKPLSKLKPYSTPLFCYSEVYCSYLIHKYFDDSAPLYFLGICKGIEDINPYCSEKGTLIQNYLNPGQESMTLLKYYKNNPDSKVNIDKYINICLASYDYTAILGSDLFSNRELGESLARQILYSMLTRETDFHYENINLISQNGEIVSLAPPTDYEYSAMFMFPDSKERNDQANRFYKESLTSPYDESDDNVILRNLICIAKNYPDLCEDFLSRLDGFISEMPGEHLDISENDFIGDFNSEYWNIPSLQKSIEENEQYPAFQNYDRKMLKRYEESLKPQRIYDGYQNDIISNFTENAVLLRDAIKAYLPKKKGNVQKILTRDN